MTNEIDRKHQIIKHNVKIVSLKQYEFENSFEYHCNLLHPEQLQLVVDECNLNYLIENELDEKKIAERIILAFLSTQKDNEQKQLFQRVEHANKNLYQVMENAGLNNASIVAEFSTFIRAHEYVKENYSEDEINDLHVDITFNHSTEY